MQKQLYAAVFGQVSFELLGGLTERFLSTCFDKNIMLKNILSTPQGITADVSYRCFKTVSEAAKKHKCTLKIIKKTGLCFVLAPYKHRLGIAAGLAVFIFMLVLAQSIVWDIRFFECTPQQQEQLRHSLYEKGVYEGAIVTRKMLDKIKKELVIESSEYGWLTLNYIKGRIVLEKTNATKKPEFVSREITNVIATQDGIVREIDASGGFVMVSEGQSVAKGDILISGIYKDAFGNLQRVHSQGKVYADLEKTYEFSQVYCYSKELPTAKRKSYYELRMLNAGIKLFHTLPTPPKSEQRLYRYPLVIFGFHFPTTVYEYEIRELAQHNIELSPEQAKLIAREKTNNAIMAELPNAKIISREEAVEDLGDALKYTVKINARADIGHERLVDFNANAAE